MARIRGRRQEDDEGGIDLTPMLDVVFIMLIFFIVTASFVKEKGIEVNRPDASDAPPDEDSVTIIVEVSDNNEIFIANRRIDVRAVRSNIQKLAAEDPSAPVIIRAGDNAEATTLVKIADAAREAGVYDVSLVSN